jgi:hypothetical protein
MIISATITSQATVLIKYPQQRDIQTFFNWHLLEHNSLDIHKGSMVFTWRTHQYRSFGDMVKFFNRTLKVLVSLDVLNFHPINMTEHNLTNHTIKREFRDGDCSIEDYTLPDLVNSDNLTLKLKEYLQDVQIMRLIFRLYNVSVNIQQLNLVLNIEIRQRLIMFVEVDTEFIETNFTTDRRLFTNNEKSNASNNN